MYLFLRSFKIAPFFALVGGLALQTLPVTRYFYDNTHLNLLPLFWFPLLIMVWRYIAGHIHQMSLGKMALWTVLLGGMFWALILTELQYLIFALFIVVPFGLRTLIYSRKKLNLIAIVILASLISLALAYFAGPLKYILMFEGKLAPGDAFDRPGIPFPSGFLSMSETWWEWDTPSAGLFIMLYGVTALFVSVGMTVRRKLIAKERWFWLIIALPPLILSLGPHLNLFGQQIPLPFVWLHQITNGMFRMPWRLLPIAVIPLTVFCGLVFTAFWNDRQRPRVLLKYAGAVAVILFLCYSLRVFESPKMTPIPPDYAVYHTIGQEPDDSAYDYVVLEIPVAAGTGEVILGDPRAVQLQWYGIYHHKRMFNGFISRAPIDTIWPIVYDDAMMAWLGQRRLLEPDVVASQLQERIFDYLIGYLMVHQNLVGNESEALQEIIGFLNEQSHIVCAPLIEQDLIAFRTYAHPDGCITNRAPPQTADGHYFVDIGGDDQRFIGLGWHRAEDVGGLSIRWLGHFPTANLILEIPPNDYELRFSTQSFAEPRMIQVLANEHSLGTEILVEPNMLQEVTVEIPSSVFENDPTLEITFQYDDVVVPSEVYESADNRSLSIMITDIELARVFDS